MTIDIMMPFYGRVDHFKSAVTSIIAQDDRDWRLVVIDDGYPDRTAGEWLQSLDDARVRYIRNEHNLGINANFQKAIDLAESEWMTIIGCDDALLPGYVSRVRELIALHPHSTLIHPGVRIIDEDGARTRTLVDISKTMYAPHTRGTVELSGERLAVSVTRGNWMYFPSVVWRREAIAAFGFRTGLNVVQDLALVIDLAAAGATLVVDDDVVFEYRRHSTSVSSWRAIEGSRFIEERNFFRVIAAEFDERGWHKARRAAQVHLSSRINALTKLPGAIRSRHSASVATLLRHAFGVNAQPEVPTR